MQKFSLCINWFNGICAVVCGLWMMVSGLGLLPPAADWTTLMPLSIYDNMPLHDVFFTGHFWPGLALLLVNGVSNVAALCLHKNHRRAWKKACLAAGILLICWTVTEMIFLPNWLSVFYLILGIMQTVAAIAMLKRA